MVTIIKEYCGNVCVVRADRYVSKLSLFDNLYNIALLDFPFLERDKVRIVHFAGRRYSGTFGIEFEVDEKVSIPTDYVKIPLLEFLR